MGIKLGEVLDGVDDQMIERFAFALEQINDLQKEIDVVGVRFAAAVDIHHVIFAQDGAVGEDQKIGGAIADIFENGAAGENFAFGLDADFERHDPDSFEINKKKKRDGPKPTLPSAYGNNGELLAPTDRKCPARQYPADSALAAPADSHLLVGISQHQVIRSRLKSY